MPSPPLLPCVYICFSSVAAVSFSDTAYALCLNTKVSEYWRTCCRTCLWCRLPSCSVFCGRCCLSCCPSPCFIGAVLPIIGTDQLILSVCHMRSHLRTLNDLKSEIEHIFSKASRSGVDLILFPYLPSTVTASDKSDATSISAHSSEWASNPMMRKKKHRFEELNRVISTYAREFGILVVFGSSVDESSSNAQSPFVVMENGNF